MTGRSSASNDAPAQPAPRPGGKHSRRANHAARVRFSNVREVSPVSRLRSTTTDNIVIPPINLVLRAVCQDR